MNSTPADSLSPADLLVLQDLHRRGFAVCVFTPLEIPEWVSIEEIEDVMCTAGNDFIER